jgi:hypothetical protein
MPWNGVFRKSNTVIKGIPYRAGEVGRNVMIKGFDCEELLYSEEDQRF